MMKSPAGIRTISMSCAMTSIQSVPSTKPSNRVLSGTANAALSAPTANIVANIKCNRPKVISSFQLENWNTSGRVSRI